MGKWVHRLSDVDGENMKAVCAHCGPVPIVFKGYSRHEGRQRLYACEKSASRFQANRKNSYGPYDRLRDKSRKKAYLLAGYEPPREGVCPICEKESSLVWDHCHASGKYRDHICALCNSALGFAKDSPETLVRAAQYLLKHK